MINTDNYKGLSKIKGSSIITSNEIRQFLTLEAPFKPITRFMINQKLYLFLTCDFKSIRLGVVKSTFDYACLTNNLPSNHLLLNITMGLGEPAEFEIIVQILV